MRRTQGPRSRNLSSVELIGTAAGGMRESMKDKFQYFVKCICFFILLGLIISSVYNVLRWKDTTGEYLSSVEQLYATPEGLIDVVFLGSSHCYCGILPAILWKQYGIAAFDMSVSSQDKNSSYHDLIELYKTQSPSVIYVDLHALTYDQHMLVSNVYRNYLSLKTSSNSVALVNEYIEEEDRESFYLRFPIIHTRYRELKKYDFLDYAPNFFGRGEYLGWRISGTWLDPEVINNRTIAELSEKNREWMEKLIALAEEHGTKIEFITIPYPPTSSEQEILNAADEMLTEMQYTYTNFNYLLDEMGIDLQNDFADAEHLNVFGAEKLTTFLGEAIVEKYDLPDHRGDERYWQWETDLKWYENAKLSNWMGKVSDPGEYVSGIMQFSGSITLVSLDGDYLNSEIDYFEILKPLGMNYEEYLSGGKWIYREGSLQKIAENTIDAQEVYYDFSRYDRVKLFYYDVLNTDNIMMGRETYQSPFPLTFVTYDTLLEKVAVCGAF